MLSLYIHRPFCDKKCKYCSFQVVPCDNLDNIKLEEKMMDEYLIALKKEISWWGKILEQSELKQELKTLYFWWGTPNKMWAKRMIEIINHVSEYFDLETLWELSIELNPYPEEETLQLIKTVQEKYKIFPRIRRSIGLQTFDPEILKESGRSYSFPAMVDFLRQLRPLKQGNTVFNFDFIAFGKFNHSKKWNSYLWDEHKQKFFQEFVFSGFADGFSLYTLELFNNSERWKYIDPKKMETNELIYSQQFGSSDDVYQEFDWLKTIVMDAGYHRYELSNFAHTSKDSIHNRVYWDMENYIWVGTSASSFINFSQGPFANTKRKQLFSDIFEIQLKDKYGLRFSNTPLLGDYLKDNYRDKTKTLTMTQSDYLIEQFFLWLRTNTWIDDITKFEGVLEKNWRNILDDFIKQNLCVLIDNKKLLLSDEGMDVFNTIVTDLLRTL